jgi:hypothetical protein
MAKYCTGDYIKAEFKDDATGESEWMWVRVDSCDDTDRIVFGRLDSLPVIQAGKLKLHSEIAVSYANVREHRRSVEFMKPPGE